jgi:acetyl-CoA/propionyl-CoA carboxylase biotin carboxyl carrier protein
LADQHGNVIVVGTRDCSLQRRHQKLVEEAPAPFLTPEQRDAIHSSAKAICREAGYHGAGTVEYLVGNDGTVSFLEVNTRLQVEHPVTEETFGIDLVREQFRIADGEKLRFTADPEPRGHSFEFRINGEDAGRGFLPAPGVVTTLKLPEGPGVRVDTGIESGTVIGGNFDSLLAKVIISGETRTEALERSRRALDEMVVEGMATVLPFHRLIIRDPSFVEEPFRVHTRWIETEWENTVAPFSGAAAADGAGEERTTVVVEVGGKRLEVSLPASMGTVAAASGPATAAKAGRRSSRSGQAASASGNALTSPMQGTIVKVTVSEGDTVAEGDLVVVLEAMKMEQPLNAHRAGVITGLTATVGAPVTSGAVICEIN